MLGDVELPGERLQLRTERLPVRDDAQTGGLALVEDPPQESEGEVDALELDELSDVQQLERIPGRRSERRSGWNRSTASP